MCSSDLSVDDGEVKALLGPNGSGKSTTMRSFMGFLNSSEGSLKVSGIDTIANPVEAKEIIGYLPGDPQLPQNLNSKSLFKLGADMRGQSIDYAMELADKFELDFYMGILTNYPQNNVLKKVPKCRQE